MITEEKKPLSHPYSKNMAISLTPWAMTHIGQLQCRSSDKNRGEAGSPNF